MIEIAFWITRIIFHACPGKTSPNSEKDGNKTDASSGLGSAFYIIFNSNKETQTNAKSDAVEDCPTKSM